MNNEKSCTSCKRLLPFEMFRRQSRTKDGLQYECRDCTGRRAAVRYAGNPAIKEKNAAWQESNKELHNEYSKKYYHSPTGRMRRALNKALDERLGKSRQSFFEIIGTSASSLIVHLMTTLPEDMKIEDYQTGWLVGFVKEPDFTKVITPEDVRSAFNWQNLKAIEKSLIAEDFGVISRDDT